MRDKDRKKERQNPHTQNRRMRHPNLSGGPVYGPPATAGLYELSEQGLTPFKGEIEISQFQPLCAAKSHRGQRKAVMRTTIQSLEPPCEGTLHFWTLFVQLGNGGWHCAAATALRGWLAEEDRCLIHL